MGMFRFAAIILPIAFLIACGTSGTTLPIESGPTTPLHNAAENNEAKVVASLLDGGADIEARNEIGATPLHFATEYNQLEVVVLLLDGGADVGARNERGVTPLHVAVAYNKPEVVALLLDRGADIESLAEFGWTPLHVAARNGEPEVVALLLDRGADITTRDDVPSQVSWGNVFAKAALIMVRLSLEALSPNRDEEGYYDSRKRDRRKRLGEILYSPVTFNPGGNMPLHFAAGFNKPDVVALLLDEGADIKARTDFGWTPLHYATIFSATPEVITLLLDRGADVHARDQDERTPLDYAKNNKHLDGTNILKRLDKLSNWK